jgi:hypothetical protein
MSVPSHISRYRKHQSGELPMSLDYSAQPLQRCDLAIASRRTILPASAATWPALRRQAFPVSFRMWATGHAGRDSSE